MFIAINILGQEMLDYNFIDEVASILRKYNIPPKRINIILTERMIMANPEYYFNKINKIKELGIRLSLNDFGRGYSSLLHLTRFPFENVKINKVFVQNCKYQDFKDTLLAITAICRRIGKAAIADGITNQSEALEMHYLGCRYVQGNLFGKPLSSKQIIAMLKKKYKIAN